MRRLLEVLPAFYGYDAVAVYEKSPERAEDARPIKVILTLRPQHDYKGVFSRRRVQANGDLVQAGITSVTLSVSEDGFYTWSATTDGDDRAVSLVADALRRHISELFGGDFSLRRYDPDTQLSGRKAIELYRGAEERRITAIEDNRQESTEQRPNGSRDVVAAPLGILTFFQMNTLLEGLINEILLPAVFFEDYTFLKEWISGDADGRGFRSIGGFINIIVVDVDANDIQGRITALDHFLAVTAREVLQKIKWSVESVRRGLLDEMMSVLHRQSSLTQLTLGETEQSPEQAIGANESQLRGYVMLAAAKLPLIINVARYASAAYTRIEMQLGISATNSQVGHEVLEAAEPRAEGGALRLAEETPRGQVATEDAPLRQYSDLEYQLSEWRGLLEAVQENIHGLENAIEHAWMERLLYEQEQVRAEQEAMAEIERSRNGRRPLISAETVINAGVLVFAVAAVVLTAQTAASPRPNKSAVSDLLVPAILGLIVLGGALAWALITRYLKVWRSRTDVYDYEFAFRLDLEVSEAKARAYLEQHKPRDVDNTGFKAFKIIRLGGARIERITPDSSLVKLHSAIIVRPDAKYWRRSRERFEVVTEILAHRVSSKNQYVLRETRIFGDTRKPLAPEKCRRLCARRAYGDRGATCLRQI